MDFTNTLPVDDVLLFFKVGRKDSVVDSPTTTAIVGVSGRVNCPDCSCDLYNITRQGDSIFFETGPGTEPDFVGAKP